MHARHSAVAESAAVLAGPELRVALFTGNYDYIKDGVALTLGPELTMIWHPNP